MKSFKSTLIFAVVVAAFVGFAYFELQKEGASKGPADPEKIFTEISSNEVVKIEIKNELEKIELKKDKAIWRVTVPVDDLADANEVGLFISNLKKQEGRDLSPKKNSDGQAKTIDWSKYGLGRNAYKVSWIYRTGQGDEVLVGTEKSFDKKYFLKYKDRLIIADGNWAELALKSLASLRDKSIYQADRQPVEFSILRGTKSLKIQKNKGEWKVQGRPDVVLDSALVNAWFTKLKGLKGNGFIKGQADSKLLKEHKLNQPPLRLLFSFDGGDKKEIAISPADKDRHYLKSSERPFILFAKKKSIDDLPKTLDYFRDKSDPFRIDGSLAQLERQVGARSDLLVKKGKLWQPLKKPEAYEVEQAEVTDLIAKVKALRAKTFFKKPKVKLVNSLHFKDENGKTLLHLQWSDKKQGEHLLLKSSRLKGFVGIDPNSMKPFKDLELVKLKKDKPAEKKEK